MTLENKIRQLTFHIQNYKDQINLLTKELSRMEVKLDELHHNLQEEGE